MHYTNETYGVWLLGYGERWHCSTYCLIYSWPLFLLLLQAAPEYWRNLDPSWKHTGPPMRRYFHQDGYHSADPHDAVWGGHECEYTIVTSFVGDGKIRDHYVRINQWPPMKVSRKEDWSWELSNHLYRYNSIPDAEKRGCTGPLFPVWWVQFYCSRSVCLWYVIPQSSAGGNQALIVHLEECYSRRPYLAAMSYGHLWRYLVFLREWRYFVKLRYESYYVW